jgi:hypothetical protein
VTRDPTRPAAQTLAGLNSLRGTAIAWPLFSFAPTPEPPSTPLPT